MKKQKGQSVVEFALVLPLFLFIIYGIIYTGMMYHDYSTLSNIARSSAREAALISGNNYSEIVKYYKEEQLSKLMTSFYIPAGSNPITISNEGDGVQSTINMQLNFNGLFVDMILPKTFGVRYYMKKE